MKHLVHVVGARPNFVKVAPLYRALQGRVRQTLGHTGQHYDASMSDVFFEQLGLPPADINLHVGCTGGCVRRADVIRALEPVILDLDPAVVAVYGDVTSTAAAALACSRHSIPVAHVEAGLRSGDSSMPEEVNRIVTDAVSDLLFTPSGDGNDNLAREGIPAGKVHFVGSVMIDALVALLPLSCPALVRSRLSLSGPFALVTLHRPSNVDDLLALGSLITGLHEIAARMDVVFPVHPRTRAALGALPIASHPRLRLVEPLGYLEFLGLQRAASFVITDSGGVQEETTFLGVPCITVRENTERPVTVTMGTNVLVGRDPARLSAAVEHALNGGFMNRSVPPLWDGHTAARIADVIARC